MEMVPRSHNMNISLISIALLLALSVATLVSVAVALYLNRWRRRLIANPKIVLEEEYSRGDRSIDTQVAKLDRLITNNTKDVREQITNLVDTFMTLQAALDERDSEIRRLKEGYDAHIFKKFVGRFIRVDRVIEDLMIEEKYDKDGLMQIRKILVDALDECDVEKFAPDKGEDFRYAVGVADNPKSVVPKTQEEEYKIIEVLEPGYRIRGQERNNVILASKVKINGAWEKGNQQ